MFRSLFGSPPAVTPVGPGPLNIKSITASDLNERIQNGEKLLLVDVRTTPEYAHDGHIAGSRLLPLNMLPRRVGELPKDAAIICICRSGNRSQAACEQLASLGYEDVTNLAGGMFGWQRAGLPIER